MNELNDRSVSFCQILRQRRMELRLRQAEIAAELRVEPETIGHWESGRRRMELDRIPRVSSVLHLDAKDLCRRALSEWHPRFHDTLFATGQPQTPPCLEESRQDAGSGRNLLLPSAASQSLEAGVIGGNGLGQPKQLA
jgi:transcriptional regulator with XRE-family HTH domain